MKHPWMMGSLMLLSLSCLGQERALNKALSDSPRAYALYTSKGKPASWDAFVAEAMDSDVVLFGELHDDPIMHWLQAELIRNMLAEGVHPTLGAEMLEADDQLVVDEFLQGWLNDDKLKAAANLWPNHKTDYHPLLELAKENDLPFIATNIPRRYASFVYMNGLDALETLSDEAKSFLPPLPIPYDPSLPGYQEMLEMGGGHGGETLPMAQASKDATMAHFISTHCQEGSPFVHFNGAYHSKNNEGIVWYLRQFNPELSILTLHGHLQQDVTQPDEEVLGLGNYLLITPESMTRTH